MRAESQKGMADNRCAENGETSALLRSHDWSQTPLGAVETWPESLKTAVQSRLAERNQAQSPESVQPASVPSQKFAPTEALRTSEAKYRLLFESIDEGFCVCEMLFDEQGEPNDYRFLEVNAAFEQLTGLEQATGKRMRELAPNHDAYWFEIYGRVVQTREPVQFENYASALNCWFRNCL
jgi:PAS domain-containing protein